MKMMDVDSENDCCTDAMTPAKKKKMRQAQLPFQRSPVGSPNVMQNKKRKLSSPSVECKNPKAIKMSKKSPRKSAGSKTLDVSSNNKQNTKDKCIDVIEDTDAENLKENATANKDESINKNATPKRLSKKLEKEALKSSPLTKFLRSSLPEKEVQASKDESVVLSSDNEDKDDPAELEENVEETSRKSTSSSDVKTPKSDKQKQKKLTPKQQERKLLSAKKKEEKERLKMEKEKKQEEERENRRKEKEQKLLEKKLKEQKKQQELEQKQKEKQAKEEERRKREEEKRKKEEEKLEVERKKQKAASNFTSFFVAKKQEKTVEEESTSKVQNFMPFEVKADMKLAPICRRTLNEAEKKTLDENRNEETSKTKLYLNGLRNKGIIPRKSSKTWPLEAKDDVILLDDDNEGNSNIVNQDIVIEKQRTKLLQFSENRRPPYWGTWRKRSLNINPRKPFSKDEKWFNYEVDSDDEWEEEEPGESLRGSDDEKDEENPDDDEYDVDNEFMVPHGYLSDEELRADEEDKEDMTPETQKFKLKVLGEQFESERNTKTSKLKPKIVGFVWRGPGNSFSENVPPRTRDFLTSREAWVRQVPVSLPTSFETDTGIECGTPTHQSASRSSKKSRFPSEAMPELIRLLHGNPRSRRFLVREFITFWNKKYKPWENQISKVSLMNKIREIAKWMACPEEGPMHLKPCWYVSEDVRKQHLEEDVQLPNQWSYNLASTRKRDLPEVEEKEDEKDKEKKNVPLITQFTKKITQEEMKKQLTASPGPASPHSKPAKKRATLISVARGEQFPKIAKESPVKRKKHEDIKAEEDEDDDDVIVIEEPTENRTVTPEKLEKENKQATPLAKGSQKKRKSAPKKLKTSNKKKKTTKQSAGKAAASSMDVEVID
ncbi:uncharacterized protein LOC143355559 isoform X2 [Halictus rubicundus]|uniref:uncharacterized protein LOC143355559 isoform X2 n=1 Tax=Halictus rubicundus TaxID=77578 RepID=UPI004036EA07